MPDRRDRDHGFTLVEVIVVIALLALISSVMAAVVAVVVRTEGPTTDRTISASSLRGLETWLSQDVVAVPPGGFDFTASAVTGCSGTSPGISLVRLTWTEQASGGRITYQANYRFEDDGIRKVIRRYTCSGPGGGPYGNRESVLVTRALAATPPTVVPITDGADTVGVTITAEAATGTTFTVSSSTRNPSATLPTTTTSTTMTPPPPCAVEVTNLPLTVANESGVVATQLVSEVRLTFVMSGACGALSLRYDRGDGGLQTEALVPDAAYPDFEVVLERTTGQRWTDGPKPMTVLNGSTAIATSTLTVS